MIPIQPHIPSSVTELYIGRDLLNENFLAPLVKRFGKRSVIITESPLKQLYGKRLADSLQAPFFEIPMSKTRETKERLEDELLRCGCDRETVLIALGGGSTTDLVSFVASTLFRGTPLLLIPTTLLAMCDASIGGKTGVDTPFGKNLIGTFYPPQAIVADLKTLSTLPEAEMINGWAEILKIALIADPSILDLIDKPTALDEVIIRSAKAKIAIVEKDPLEKGMRRILNFGHTIGHALETALQYKISHGNAVAIGTLTESWLSHQLGYLPKDELEKIQTVYQKKLGTLALPSFYNRNNLLSALFFDKKKQAGCPRFVLIDRIGHALPFEGAYCRSIEEKQIALALSEMEKRYG